MAYCGLIFFQTSHCFHYQISNILSLLYNSVLTYCFNIEILYNHFYEKNLFIYVIMKTLKIQYDLHTTSHYKTNILLITSSIYISCIVWLKQL